MSTKLSKEDIKNPDLLTQELKKGFEWSTKHIRLLVSLFVLFILGGIGFSFYTHTQTNKEISLQEKFYEIEKDFLKKKEAFEKFETSSKLPVDPKTKTAKVEGEKASGDIEKDYGQFITEFEKLVEQAPKSRAAHMSALHVSELFRKYGQLDEGLHVLGKIQAKDDLLASLVNRQIGNLYADKKDCNNAITSWTKIIDSKKVSYLHSEVLLQKGLCLETLGDVAKAEEAYNKIINEDKDGQVSKTAQRYLRLLKMKVN